MSFLIIGTPTHIHCITISGIHLKSLCTHLLRAIFLGLPKFQTAKSIFCDAMPFRGTGVDIGNLASYANYLRKPTVRIRILY